MKIKFPVWWLVLAGIYMLLYINSVVSHHLDQIRWQKEGWPFHKISETAKLKAAYSGSLLSGLESTIYFYAGTIMVLGSVTLLAFLIYAFSRELDHARGVSIGFIAVLVLQMVLQICIDL